MLRQRSRRPLLIPLRLALLVALAAPVQARDTPELDPSFERDVRPLLAEHCFSCHGPEIERPKGGLRMTGQASLLVGGTTGPAIVPGGTERSLMLRLVRGEVRDMAMPPDEPLSDREVAILEAWVADGAPWPGGDAHAEVQQTVDVEAGRDWWAFTPRSRPVPPAVPAASPVDAFVLARLEREGLRPNPPASRRELARRAFFDLIGLPPTLEEVTAFEQDPRPDAWERLIDDLLARPEYGQRWGRHWLDVVRYAETAGYERDQPKPFAWRYRDWVIDAFNADKPYDRFLLEQLAGDELPDADDGSLVATGFYRLGAWDSEPDDARQAVFDELDDIVRTIGEGVLGVTVGCARCHDHKYDPFPQEDYYGLVAFVRGIEAYAPARFNLRSPTLRPLGADAEALDRWDEAREVRRRQIAEEEARLVASGEETVVQARMEQADASVRRAWFTAEHARSPRQQAQVERLVHVRRKDALDALSEQDRRRLFDLQAQREGLDADFEGELDWALTVRERSEVPETRILVRGLASAPGRDVEPHVPRVLVPEGARGADVVPGPDGSGRRLALAEWITSDDNPLTARVLVNRVWQHHFGRGLVATPDDFGSMGTAPTHPELLDWLADTFVSDGWSVKALHRRIMTSEAYRRSSRPGDAAAVDPDNTLLWRQSIRRLDAEALRDGMLAVSGELDTRLGGPSFYPRLNRTVLAGESRPGAGWGLSDADERSRRSVYAHAKRNLRVPILEAFDAADPSLPQGRRTVTTIAPQALLLLNSEFAHERAAAFARDVAATVGEDPEARVREVYARALSREPDEEQLRIGREYLLEQERALASAPARLVFRRLLPDRVAREFLEQVGAEDVLAGPRDGWTYLEGLWGNPYNHTLENLPEQPASALLDRTLPADVVVRGQVAIEADTAVGLLVGARAEGAEVRGLELRIEPSEGLMRLIGHGADAAEVLAEGPVVAAAGSPSSFTLALDGGEVRVGWNGHEVLRADRPEAVGPGRFGVRVDGTGVAFSELQLESTDRVVRVGPDAAGPASLRALESLCLLVFNLNEFVYVD